MKKLLFLIPILGLTACNRLIKPIMSSHLSNPVASADGRITQDIKMVVWGQSNMNNPITPLAICQAITSGECEIHNFSVSNTSSWYWTNPINHQALINDIASFQPDFVLCAQGESDSYTTRTDYYNNMIVIWDKIKLAAPQAYRGISLNSNVDKSNPRDGQFDLISSGIVHQGVDMDSYRSSECSPPDPHMNPHFTDPCKIKIGTEWGRIISH